MSGGGERCFRGVEKKKSLSWRGSDFIGFVAGMVFEVVGLVWKNVVL